MKYHFAKLAALALSTALPPVANAQTPGFVHAELLPGWKTESGSQMAALRVVLEDGWKTYWRTPGEAGIPPEFDWTGSRNIGLVTVHWPQPQVFDTYGIRTVGYANEMVLPIEVMPLDPASGVWMAGEVSIGICHDICVPVTLDLEALLEGPGQADILIARALDARPASRPGTAHCTTEPVLDGVRVTAEIAMPPLGGKEVAVFELSGVPVWISDSTNHRQGGVLIASTEIVPFDTSIHEIKRSDLTITVIGNGQAVEIIGCSG